MVGQAHYCPNCGTWDNYSYEECYPDYGPDEPEDYEPPKCHTCGGLAHVTEVANASVVAIKYDCLIERAKKELDSLIKLKANSIKEAERNSAAFKARYGYMPKEEQ